jgi:hypothetical protein
MARTGENKLLMTAEDTEIEVGGLARSLRIVHFVGRSIDRSNDPPDPGARHSASSEMTSDRSRRLILISD